MSAMRVIILAFFLTVGFGLAAEVLSADLSSESTLVRGAGGRSDQNLTEERGKVREFVDRLVVDENHKPSQSEGKDSAPSAPPVSK